MWCGSWCWDNFIKYFELHGFECITPTLRYHDADPSANPHPKLGVTSLLDYSNDLEHEIRQIDDKPIIMGHSMGGLLGQILASRGLAKKLILLSPASPAGINALKYTVIKSFWSVFTKFGFWRLPHRPPFNDVKYSMLHLLPTDLQLNTYSKLVYESGRAATEIGFWLLDSKRASAVDESKVLCPVLVVAGSEDRITPSTVIRRVAGKYSAVSTYVEFADHAHWVLGEPNWEEIAGYVAKWIKK